MLPTVSSVLPNKETLTILSVAIGLLVLSALITGSTKDEDVIGGCVALILALLFIVAPIPLGSG